MMVHQDLNQVVEILLVIVDEELVLGMIIDQPLVLDEQLVLDIIADERMLYIVVIVEEMCRLVVVVELLKDVDDTVMECIEVDDYCSMNVCCKINNQSKRIKKSLSHHTNFVSMDLMLPKIHASRIFSLSVRSSIVLTLVDASVVRVPAYDSAMNYTDSSQA
nr:hypothetical protein [Tanacetum cinerariifolium]